MVAGHWDLAHSFYTLVGSLVPSLPSPRLDTLALVLRLSHILRFTTLSPLFPDLIQIIYLLECHVPEENQVTKII